MFWCSSDKQDDEEETLEEIELPSVDVLMEVVSARDLSHKKVDPHCIIRCGRKEVHKTKTIYNDPDPIWTVLTGSLCLLKIPENLETENEEDSSVVVEVCHGNQCIGVVAVPFTNVLRANGEREEYLISTKLSSTNNGSDDKDRRGTLALRFRLATREDIAFFQPARPSFPLGNAARASDINFKYVRTKSVLKANQMTGADHKDRFRVQPYPDPDCEAETTWLTKEEIYDGALKPSKNWSEAGYGQAGRVYVEIIGCDNLPNMDVGIKEKSDPFVGIVFEDTMVRTNIIHDALRPRWMPWCSRAFAFNISHPSSMLFLGVFDYDSTPLKDHDPIGRVVINTANFQSSTSYLLHYTLHDDPHQEDSRGTIIIRLRVEWRNEAEARRLAFTIPPRFLINVESAKSFDVLRYICRGKVNMEKASLNSVKLYAKELMSYGKVWCYLVDVMIGILLWRGRANLSIGSLNRNVWFPIHSIALLTAAVVAVEKPHLLPMLFFYGIAWIMLTINYHGSHYPYPWNRCKSWTETNKVLLLGRSVHPPVKIEPYTGVEEAKALEELDKVKAARVAGFLWDFKTVGLHVRRVYKKTNMLNISIETEDDSWAIFSDNLSYLHLFLYYLCTYLRMFRNLVNWRGYYAHKFTMTCLVLGTMWLILPVHLVVLWVMRIFVWAFLGPWMKLVDIYFVHEYYRTREEILEDPTFHGTNLESVLTSETLKKMGASVRIASEDALKLKDMRKHKFGKMSELVPPLDTSRFHSVPLPQSYAMPYGSDEKGGFEDVPLEAQRWQYVSGQKLEGHMIPKATPP